MLGTSEQDLSSSYRDVLDSDTEDYWSTNGSAGGQNLFISMSESDSENSGIDIARHEKKKKKIEEESGSEVEGMNKNKTRTVFTQHWNSGNNLYFWRWISTWI